MSVLTRGIRAGLAVAVVAAGCDLSVTEPRRSIQAHADAAGGATEGGLGGSDAEVSDAGDISDADVADADVDVADVDIADADVDVADAEAGTWAPPPPVCPVDAGAPCCFMERVPLQGLAPDMDFWVLKVLRDGRIALGGSEVQDLSESPVRDRPPVLFIGDETGGARVPFATAEPVLQPDAGMFFGEDLFPQGRISDIVQKENGDVFAVGTTSLVRNDGWALNYFPLLYQENVGGWAAVPVIFPRNMGHFSGPQRAGLYRAAVQGNDLLFIGDSSDDNFEEDYNSFSLRYDGSRFTELDGTPVSAYGTWSDGDAAYLVGNNYTYDEFGNWVPSDTVILRLVGQDWLYETISAASGTPEASLDGIEMVGTTEPIAVASVEGGGLALLSRTGDAWTYTVQTDPTLSDVGYFRSATSSGTDVLVAQGRSWTDGVFDDKVLRWDGISWSTLCTGGMRINDIAVSNGTLYLAGSDASGGVLATLDLN